VAFTTMSVLWVDVNGGKTIQRINTATGAAGILGALSAASLAAELEEWEGTDNQNPAPAPTTGPYQGVAWRAALTFVCADSTLVNLILVAPLSSCFLADAQTIDPASVPVAAIISAVVGTMVNPAGSLVTAFVAGSLLPHGRTPAGG
jgi:hypothetical protein